MSEQETPRAVHQRAMSLAFEADTFQASGDMKTARAKMNEACELASFAALHYRQKHDCEPTRGKLFLSAAILCLDAERWTEAEANADLGLAGKPSDGVAWELLTVKGVAQAKLRPASREENTSP
jgi:hypothetical protein